MAKISGGSMYAERGDDLFKKGKEFAGSKEIEKFCKNVMDKTFDNWVLVGRDFDAKNFKEIDGGHLMSGMVLCNINPKGKHSKLAEISKIKHLDGKSNLAMMVLDLLEGICEDGREVEDFLEALLTTAKRTHAQDRGEDVGDIELESLERAKLKILKELLLSSVDTLNSYNAKEKFLRSCLGSVVVARILSTNDERLKDRMRKSMKAAVAGDEEGGAFATKSVDRIDDWVKTLLDSMDAGLSPEEIAEALKTFNNNL